MISLDDKYDIAGGALGVCLLMMELLSFEVRE